MRKILTSLGVLLLLSACTGEMDNADETSSEEAAVEDVQEEQQGSAGREEAVEEQEGAETDEDTVASESEEITFVPQQSDVEAGLSVENDEVLMTINELVVESTPDDLGFADDVTIQFTGLYFESEDRLQPIFAITNRTEEAFTNIELILTFGLSEDELLFDEAGFNLSEEEFGVLAPDTVMPLYLDADPSQLPLVEEISETREEIINIDGMDFETVDNEL